MRRGVLSRLKRAIEAVPGVRAVLRFVRHRVDPGFQAGRALHRAGAPDLLQPFPTTQAERYPLLFDAIAERLDGVAEARILSFGCSTGEEVAALARRFPNGRVIGVDLNPVVIERARQAYADLEFHCAATPPDGMRFHAILAMAVLRFGHQRDVPAPDLSQDFPFAKFEQAVARLDAALEPGGLLAIWHAHYRFRDLDLARGYEDDDFAFPYRRPQEPLYGRDGRLMEGVTEKTAMFRKAGSLASGAPVTAEA